MKNVLITGAAVGIGKEIVKFFAKNNYNIVFSYLTNDKKAEELKNYVKENYDISIYSIKCDITNENEIIDMIKFTNDKLGSIDILINNAAYYCDNTYDKKSKEEFMKVLEVNVVGTFLVTKYALLYMNNGVVINMSSLDGNTTYNQYNIDYSVSKASVNMLSKCFSISNLDNKFISVMLPWIKTKSTDEMDKEFLNSELKRTNQKRLIEPNEVAEKIYNLTLDKNIKSGSIITMEFD